MLQLLGPRRFPYTVLDNPPKTPVFPKYPFYRMLVPLPIPPTSQPLINTCLLFVCMSSAFLLCLLPCLDASQHTFQAVDAAIFSTALPSCAFDHIYSITAIKTSLPSLHSVFPLALQQLSLPACFKFKWRFMKALGREWCLCPHWNPERFLPCTQDFPFFIALS